MTYLINALTALGLSSLVLIIIASLTELFCDDTPKIPSRPKEPLMNPGAPSISDKDIYERCKKEKEIVAAFEEKERALSNIKSEILAIFNRENMPPRPEGGIYVDEMLKFKIGVINRAPSVYKERLTGISIGYGAYLQPILAEYPLPCALDDLEGLTSFYEMLCFVTGEK